MTGVISPVNNCLFWAPTHKSCLELCLEKASCFDTGWLKPYQKQGSNWLQHTHIVNHTRLAQTGTQQTIAEQHNLSFFEHLMILSPLNQIYWSKTNILSWKLFLEQRLCIEKNPGLSEPVDLFFCISTAIK